MVTYNQGRSLHQGFRYIGSAPGVRRYQRVCGIVTDDSLRSGP